MSLDSVVLEIASWLPPLRRRDGFPVLCYHEVQRGSTTGLGRFAVMERTLEAHIDAILSSGRTVLSLDERSPEKRSAVLLTFDDNLPTHVSSALPILRAAGVKAVFFLTPGDLGSDGQLSRRDVDMLLESGMWIGAHGNHHSPAARFGAEEFALEVRECASFLRAIGMPLTWAYPGGYIGSFGDIHEQILLDNGFELRFSTLEGLCRDGEHHRAQGRYVIRRDSSSRYVRAALDGGLQAVGLLKRAQALWS